ncbi:SLC13 family permease [Nonomuraea soli]|uniref:Na+/H+ antiporter NhaD/arsenite permease-like protein n=1 Tax=Nonomuraea soli TaxID=1032476 RepID=A0A7W0HNI6_9ACTN|nr:SLC13 family permease [Nonomuraea soli]MBA2889823.1 Na+/H+ antiporter NhaD/arsenite permease-like protein [Nonomuraea soli]
MRWRLSFLDGVAVGLPVLGVLLVLVGLLPVEDVVESLDEVVPLLGFLTGLMVLAALSARAQVFDAVAARLAVLGRGNYALLFAASAGFATVVTIFLNLDTTAVLLTPVLLALAARSGISPLPLAMTTLWLSAAASLLLPVSNLTNLLATDKIHLSAAEFARLMLVPQAAVLAVTLVLLWVMFWRLARRGERRYEPRPPERVADRVTLTASAVACLLFAAAIVAGAEAWLAALSAAAIVVVVFVVRDRSALSWSLIPWRLLGLVAGLTLIVPALAAYGLADLMAALVGDDRARTAATGLVLANAVNGLPAYLAVQLAVPVGRPEQLAVLLAAVNAGAVITPWASTTTLLWLESCRRYGVSVPLGRFMASGLVLAVAVTVTAVLVTG